MLVTVLITFFPIAMTVFDGFRSAKTDMVDMLQDVRRGARGRCFLKLKITGRAAVLLSRRIKMAIPLSIIGAAIGEWLGAQAGCPGYFSRRMMTQLDGAGVFAPIVLLSAVAMLAVGSRKLGWRKRVVTWRGSL